MTRCISPLPFLVPELENIALGHTKIADLPAPDLHQLIRDYGSRNLSDDEVQVIAAQLEAQPKLLRTMGKHLLTRNSPENDGWTRFSVRTSEGRVVIGEGIDREWYRGIPGTAAEESPVALKLPHSKNPKWRIIK